MLLTTHSLLSKVRSVSRESDAEDILNELKNNKHPKVVSFLNINSIVTAINNDEFKNSLLASDLVFRDGIGLREIQKKLGYPSGVNMNGTDFIPQIISQLKSRPLVLIGSTPFNSLQAKLELEKDGFNILLHLDGYRDDKYLIEQYIASGINNAVVIIGMGSPLQEIFSRKLYNAALQNNLSPLIVNGGAIIDRFAKEIKRSPAIFLKYNIEWLYRLMVEPSRLFKRNLKAATFMFMFIIVTWFDRMTKKII